MILSEQFKYLSKEDARQLAISDKKIMDFFYDGYKSTMEITNSKLMNDQKVRPNYYLVNVDFESNPKCFTAIYEDRVYRVLRCVYVGQAYRRKKLASEMISELKSGIGGNEHIFLQIGVECNQGELFTILDKFYSNEGFKRTFVPITHGNNKSFYDYFWSHKPFEVKQNGLRIAAHHI